MNFQNLKDYAARADVLAAALVLTGGAVCGLLIERQWYSDINVQPGERGQSSARQIVLRPQSYADANASAVDNMDVPKDDIVDVLEDAAGRNEDGLGLPALGLPSMMMMEEEHNYDQLQSLDQSMPKLVNGTPDSDMSSAGDTPPWSSENPDWSQYYLSRQESEDGATATPDDHTDWGFGSPSATQTRTISTGSTVFGLEMEEDEMDAIPGAAFMLPSPTEPGADGSPYAAISAAQGSGLKRMRKTSSPRFQVTNPGNDMVVEEVKKENMKTSKLSIETIPLEVISEQQLPPELASALLNDDSFEPGNRPTIFSPANKQFLFKERTGGARMPGDTKDSGGDRWHNSGGVKGSRDMPLDVPLVRRRYGSIIKHSKVKDFRYHEYSRVRIIEIGNTRTFEEDRSVILFHVMIKRRAKGRPTKAESEAPAKSWAGLGIGFEQRGQSIVPTNGPRQMPNVTRSPAPGTREAGSGTTTPVGPVGSKALPWHCVNESAMSVHSGNAIMSLCAPTNHHVKADFISFCKGQRLLGRLKEADSGLGVLLESAGGDIAEWHRLANGEQKLNEGELVGLYDGGVICRRTHSASMVGVITRQAFIKGSMPPDQQRCEFDTVAYIGKVPIRVRGAVRSGDLLVPSGKGDGVAIVFEGSDDSTGNMPPVIVGVALAAAWRNKEGRTFVNASVVPPSTGRALGAATAAGLSRHGQEFAKMKAEMVILLGRVKILESKTIEYGMV